MQYQRLRGYRWATKVEGKSNKTERRVANVSELHSIDAGAIANESSEKSCRWLAQLTWKILSKASR